MERAGDDIRIYSEMKLADQGSPSNRVVIPWMFSDKASFYSIPRTDLIYLMLIGHPLWKTAYP